jgi:hypothetical protein
LLGAECNVSLSDVLSPSGAQAGEMPTERALRSAALNGRVEEVRQLIEARANIEDPDAVSDGAGTSVTAGELVWYGV